MIRPFSLILLLTLLPSTIGFAAEKPTATVVASFTILADMAAAIGGDDVSVTTLVGPDKDAHVYEPTPADVRTLRHASLLIVNGMGFEGWMDRLIEASGFSGVVVTASQGVVPLRSGSGASDDAVDPHAWQALPNARLYAANIAEGLIRVRPTHGAKIRKAALAYDIALASTDAWVHREFASVPPARRKVITSHDAFRYFGREYDVEFLAPQGWSTESQPTATNVASLIRHARRERITALFVENISDPRLLEQIARETGARVGGRLYSDALSQPDGPAGTYLDMFRHNVKTLVSGMTEPKKSHRPAHFTPQNNP